MRQLTIRAAEIGRKIEQVDHIFITHEHTDHIQGLPVLLKKYKPVIWASRGTLHRLRKKIPGGTRVRLLNSREEIAGDIKVKAIPISHDAAEPLAFRMDCELGSIAVVTDLGSLNPVILEGVRGTDVIACEANHDLYMLQNGPYPGYLKHRIASPLGHLSNEDGASLALEAVRHGTSHVILGHLSEENNTPEIAHEVFADMFKRAGFNPTIDIARQSKPGPWVELKKKELSSKEK